MFRFLSLIFCLFIIASGTAFAQFSVKSPSEQGLDEDVSIFDQLPPEIQQDIVDEAEVVRIQCGKRTGMNTYNDCECAAAKWLEARARDPMQLRSWLINKVMKECPNIPGIAGDAYDGCRSTTSRMEYHSAEKYCTCVGNRTAMLYEQSPPTKISGLQNLQVRARLQCQQELNIRAN